ncbi:ATPase with role in protein import into the ER [Mortierella sp. 14UC]|nr:ATPase with role in protein import into the ER [Mortierella sp. 14UC]
MPTAEKNPLFCTVDLGITYTSANYVKDGEFHYVTDEYGRTLIPSYISFVNDPNNNTATQILVGQDAKVQLETNPENTIFNWQRLFHLRYGDPIVQFEINHRRVPYKIVSSFHSPPHSTYTSLNHDGYPPLLPQGKEGNRHSLGFAMIQVTDTHNQKQLFRPEDLTALLVSKIKERAELQSGKAFNMAIVTVPTDYTDNQRWALEEAIRGTGLHPLRLMSRHHAPTFGYTRGRELEEEEEELYMMVLVNLDPEYIEVAVVELDEGVFELLGLVEQPARIPFDDKLAARPVIEFLIGQHLNRMAKNINGRLGERAVAQHVMSRLNPGHKDDLPSILNDPIAMKRLQNELRKVNDVFTSMFPSPLRPPEPSQNFVRIEIENLFNGLDFSERLSFSQWQEFRQATLKPILMETMEQALKKASIDQSTVNMVVVAGASPFVPDAIRLLKHHFHFRKVDIPSLPDPALATLEGASAIAATFGAVPDSGPCVDMG